MGAYLGKRHINTGLSDVNTSDLRKYVQELIDQEHGIIPNVNKINGNMAWYKRARDDSDPMNQYFDSFGRDGKKVLADLKNRFPDIFGRKDIQGYKHSSDNSSNGVDKSSDKSNDGADANTLNQTVDTSSIPMWVWWGGGAGLGGIILIAALKK